MSDQPDYVPRFIISALLFALLMLIFMPPLVWNDNEAHYFMLSYRRVAPDLFSPNNVVFHDTGNSRFLGEYLIGGVVSYLGYETAHALLRSLMAVAYGTSLAYLFAVLRLSLSEGVIVLYTYTVIETQTLGGEWLFWGIETKTMAYAAVFTALAFGIRGRWKLAVTFAALATYLHFLVGGFWTVVLLLIYFHLHTKIRQTLYFAAIYAFAVFPLLAILVFEQFTSVSPRSEDGLTADYIISFLRGPHHVAPFSSEAHFWADWAPQILATTVAAITCLGLLQFVKSRITRTLLLTVIGICSYLLIALIISFFDRNTGALGKFFLFRPSALGLLLFLAALALSIKEVFSTTMPKLTAILLIPMATLIFGISLLDAVSRTRDALADQLNAEKTLRPLLKYIEVSTDKKSVILIDPSFDSAKYMNIRRLIVGLRPTLVGNKYIPTDPAGIIRWHNLMNFRKKIFREGCVVPMKHRVDFILVSVLGGSRDQKELLFSSCGKLVVSTDQYFLVKVEDELRLSAAEGPIGELIELSPD